VGVFRSGRTKNQDKQKPDQPRDPQPRNGEEMNDMERGKIKNYIEAQLNEKQRRNIRRYIEKIREVSMPEHMHEKVEAKSGNKIDRKPKKLKHMHAEKVEAKPKNKVTHEDKKKFKHKRKIGKLVAEDWMTRKASPDSPLQSTQPRHKRKVGKLNVEQWMSRKQRVANLTQELQHDIEEHNKRHPSSRLAPYDSDSICIFSAIGGCANCMERESTCKRSHKCQNCNREHTQPYIKCPNLDI